MNNFPAELAPAIFAGMTEGLIISDLNGNVVDMNPAALRMHGFRDVGESRINLRDFKSVFELRLPGGEIVPIERWPLSRALRGETFTNYELIVRRTATGEEWQTAYGGALICDDRNKPACAIVTLHDLTIQRKLQQLILERDAALRLEHERLRLVLDGARDYGIYMVDAEGRIATWNTGAERLKQWRSDEVIGQHFRMLYTEEDQAVGWPEHNLQLARERGFHHEERLRRRKDGTTFEADVDIHAVYASDGTLLGYSKISRDIADRVAARREKDRLEKELSETTRQQQQFLADVLRNVSEGKLRLCLSADELPQKLPDCSSPIKLTRQAGLRELREATRRIAVRLGMEETRSYDVLTAVAEAGMNAVVHAGGGRGLVCAGPDQVQVWVEDTGRGIKVESLPHATLGKGFTTAGSLGQGMKLMLQTIDRLYLLTRSSGTTVVIEQNRVAEPPPWLFGDHLAV